MKSPINEKIISEFKKIKGDENADPLGEISLLKKQYDNQPDIKIKVNLDRLNKEREIFLKSKKCTDAELP